MTQNATATAAERSSPATGGRPQQIGRPSPPIDGYSRRLPSVDIGRLMTAQEVAEYLGLHKNTITGYRSRGQMPPPDKQYGRTPLWSKATIDDWRRQSSSSQ